MSDINYLEAGPQQALIHQSLIPMIKSITGLRGSAILNMAVASVSF
jgi:hypothetical protein